MDKEVGNPAFCVPSVITINNYRMEKTSTPIAKASSSIANRGWWCG